MRKGPSAWLAGMAFAAICAAQPSMPAEMLAAHNAVRASHSLHPLKWSDKLAAHAQQWADTLLANNWFEHRKSRYGENLFTIRNGHSLPELVVDSWADEASDYDYRSNKCRKMCGHYTQLVWSSTRTVGCAVARSPTREVWVCNYDPPGNYVGERPY